MQSRDPYTLDNVVGYGFRPSDEELVFHYLKHKLLGDGPRVHVMPDIELCDVEPWDVPVMLAESMIRFNDPEWFFFSRVDYKYSNSKRVNRTTKCGYWKTTGKERQITCTDTNTVIGTKKTLVFYEGRVPDGVRSNWVIHEYHDATFHESQRTFVVCRLIKKPEKTSEGEIDALICNEWEPSRSIVSGYENHPTAEGIPSEGTFTEIGTTFQEKHQAENGFSPILQSPIGIGQEEASFQNFPFYNAYFRNEHNLTQTPLFETTQTPFETTQTPFETTQTSFETTQTPFEITQTPFETTEEYDFLNSILADEILANEESMNTFVNSSPQSESLRRVYCESSDTDAEVISQILLGSVSQFDYEMSY